jgi:hypothetical protein
MAVTIDSTRKAVNINWDIAAVDADRVDIHTRNPATGDLSERLDLPNDGAAVLTYPVDFTGTSQVIVVPAGTEVPESGEISPGEGDTGDVEV